MRVRGFGFVIGVLALGSLFGPRHFATRAINAESQPPGLTATASPSASAAAARVGPSYLYPDPKATPGAVNPDITQANIGDTICNPDWSTKSIRPPASYTNALKKQQLASPKYTDKNPSHYEEDHLVSLELGGHPRDPKNLWPEMWGTPAHPLTSRGPFPPHLVGAKSKDAVEGQLHKEVCAGALTLDEARTIIAIDWFKYYREQVLK